MRECFIEDVGHLYVIADGKYGSPWIKVGRSTRPAKRLVEYNSSFPEDRLEFAHLSCELYNLSECEAMLIAGLKDLRSVTFAEGRREWVKHRYSKSAMVATVKGIIDTLEKTYAH